MLSIFNRGLSKEEIAKTLKKIRKQYNDYIITYLKSPRAKEEFENRYYFSAKYKENMAHFFKNEINILNDLIQLEVDKQREKEKDKLLASKRRERQNGGGFADKILKDLEDRIAHYPELNINKESSVEIRKLYGALKVFEDRYWSSFSKYIKVSSPSGRIIDHLENDLWLLIGSGRSNFPVLDKYLFLLERPEQDLKAISIAEQACMKKAAFFLNDILTLYRRSMEVISPPSSATDGYNYASQLVFNFRLTEFKKS